eukprot:jgi/Bigna1/72371/fgenesh1_pg.19_\
MAEYRNVAHDSENIFEAVSISGSDDEVQGPIDNEDSANSGCDFTISEEEQERFNFPSWLAGLTLSERELMTEFLQGEVPTLKDLSNLSREMLIEDLGSSATVESLWGRIQEVVAERKRRKKFLRYYNNRMFD